MFRTVFMAICLLLSAASQAQGKYFTKEGKVSFFSDAPMEKIEAFNRKASSVYDATTGKLEWSVLIKAFQFEKALMQEHFNENYMESDKYPKATFKGQVVDAGRINLAKDGQYPVKVKGTLEIHGVSQEVQTDGVFVVKGGKIQSNAGFTIAVADYGITIPAVVRDKVAKTVRIEVSAEYQPLTK